MGPGGAPVKGAFLIEEGPHGGVCVVAPPHGESGGGVGSEVFPGSPEAGEAADGFLVAPPLGAPGEGGGSAGEVDVAPVLVGQVLGDELGHVRVDEHPLPLPRFDFLEGFVVDVVMAAGSAGTDIHGLLLH